MNSSMRGHGAAAAVPWYRTITREQWRVLLAAKFGWMLDAMDFMLYTMAVGQLRTLLRVRRRHGGHARHGHAGDVGRRRRDLRLRRRPVRPHARADGHDPDLLARLARRRDVADGDAAALWRALLGIGMGGEWASGAVLVSETWPAHLRNKAISIMQSGWALGYMLASISAALILGSPSLGADAWRWLFVVGVVPALFTLWIRRYVREPETWTQEARRPPADRSPFAVIFGPALHQAHAAHHRARLRGAVRQLGTLLLAAGVPRPARRARRRRHGRRRIAAVDHPGAARRLRRLPDVRIHRRSHRTTAGVRALHGGGGDAGAALRADGAQPVHPARARSAARLLRLRLLQHVRRLRRRAVSGGACAPPDRARATTSDAWPARSRRTRSA